MANESSVTLENIDLAQLDEKIRVIAQKVLEGQFNGNSTDPAPAPPLDLRQAQLIQRVNKLRQRAIDMGVDPALTEPRESLFGKIIDTLNIPLNAVLGNIDTIVNRGDFAKLGVLGAARRGIEEKITTADILRRAGVKDPIARAGIGLAGDILLDPLNLIAGAGKGVIKAGGVALTESGVKRIQTIKKLLMAEDGPVYLMRASSRHAVKAIKDPLAAEIAAADIFEKIANLEKYKRYEKIAVSLSDKAKYRQKILEARKGLINFDNADEVFPFLDKIAEDAGFNYEKDVADKVIRVGTAIPFLGAITDSFKANKVDKSLEAALGQLVKPTKTQKVLQVAGKVFKPLEVTKNIKIPRPIEESTVKFFSRANKLFEDIETKARSLNKVGKAIGSTIDTARKAKKIAKLSLGHLFSSKLLYGAEGARKRIDLINYRASVPTRALNHTLEVFPEFKNIANLSDTERAAQDALFSEATLAIDAAAVNVLSFQAKALKEAMADTTDILRAKEAQALDAKLGREIENILRGQEADLELFKELKRFLKRDFDSEFFTLMDAEIARRPKDDPVSSVLARAVKAMRDIAEEEKKFGVNMSLIEAYIPHLYKGKINTSPFKNRRITTFSEAAVQRGLIGNTSVVQLLMERKRRSLIAIANKTYGARFLITQGLHTDTLAKLYKAANENPNGVEARLLKGMDFKMEELIPAEKEAMQAILGKQSEIVRGQREFLSGTEKGQELLKGLHPSIANDILETMKEQELVLNEGIYKAGFRPFDEQAFKGYLGHIGQEVEINRRKYFMPTEIAKAANETIKERDLLKATIGRTKAGAAIINLFDSIHNSFKTMVTVPWPGYWVQNVFGDTFFRLLDGGVSALSPGLMARTSMILDGTASLKTASGRVITPDEFKRILNSFGIEYDSSAFLDLVRNASDLDWEKHLRKVKTLKQVAKDDSKIALAKEALSRAEEAVRARFENFFRINQLVHHLEQGEPILDAVRRSSEAMINYRDLTPIEQSVFRRFFLFYGWLKGSTKRSLFALFTQPGHLNKQIAVARGISEAFSDPDALPTIEEYNKGLFETATQAEQITFPLGRDKEGNRVIGRGFGLPLNTILQQFSLSIPRSINLGEVASSLIDDASRTIQKQFAAANPTIKAPAELLLAKKSFFFDASINSRFLRRIPQMALDAQTLAKYPITSVPNAVFKSIDKFTQEWLGGVPDGKGNIVLPPARAYILMNLIPGLSRLISTVRPFKSDKNTISQAALRALTGVRIERNDPERTFLFRQEKALKGQLIDATLKRENLGAGGGVGL